MKRQPLFEISRLEKYLLYTDVKFPVLEISTYSTLKALDLDEIFKKNVKWTVDPTTRLNRGKHHY